jgi:O-antigen/teichoic acid export membrane protein
MAEPKNVPISKRLVLINSASGIVTRLLTVGVFAWVIQHLMKRIPEEELQLLPIVGSIAMILPFLQTVLTAGLARHVTAAYARHDLAQVTAIVSSQFPLLLGTAVVASFVTAGLTLSIDRLLNIPPQYVGTMQFMLVLVSIRIVVGMLLVPFNTGLFARQRFVIQNTIEIAGSLIRIALMLGLILFAGPKVQWVIVAMVASQLFVAIVTTIVSVVTIPALRYRPSTFDWAICRENLSFGWWYFIIQMASFIRRSADAPILNKLASPLAVNDFFVGSTVDLQLREMTVRASIPLLPALTAMHVQGQEQRLAAAYLRAARVAMWVSLFLVVPFVVFSYDLLALYLGRKYPEHVDTGTVMILLLLGVPLTTSVSIYGQIAQARGVIRSFAILTVVGQLGNLVLTLLLVGPFAMGAVGSAAATLISYAVINPFFIWPLALRSLRISWGRFLYQSFLPGLLPAVVAGCAGFVLGQLVGPSNLWRVVVGAPTCMLTYCVGLLLALQPADRADLARVRRAVGV